MAKGMPKKEAENDSPELLAEVKAFASQLGLSGAGGGAFEYDDFAPAKAKQRAAAADGGNRDAQQPKGSKGKQQRRDENGRPSDGAPHGKGQKQQQQHDPRPRGGKTAAGPGAAAAAAAAAAEAQRIHDEAVQGRTWVDSVGPRPGESKGRSLMSHDEPTIWFEAAALLPKLDPAGRPPLGEEAAEKLRAAGEQLIEREAAAFERDLEKRNAADHRWLGQVRRGGTTADKVAAMTLLVQESAAANLKSLDGLLSLMAKRKGGKGVVAKALEALQELFLTCLLPDRRLRVLEQQPLQALPPGRAGEKHLLLWCVEDAMKSRYSQFVGLLEGTSTDPLDYLKAPRRARARANAPVRGPPAQERATKALSSLLSAKPEGEARLLAALVNKLGDPSRKVASNAGFLLGRLLEQHPAMKPVVVRECALTN
ncbi:Uncharacterized protein MNEG_13456 [Monoraphidium neglectum]|uniref:CCAAT/enhancer-binding protein zeta n=1 Tax=Monoraphidium neglectum TaxID=145388 RepID=A0A0D2MHH9_9CHLO|nr:Uncharacterized protein MNEG_13456 [Monoraphidium neglectum]KIY94505.1 Uncharacterized protein MNEG_13456 [Monoraphidium neglectum]|eukprot:XP_013893525.1 Uncharacterized protein MNEG_13456 [Monoraphidium neglectum]